MKSIYAVLTVAAMTMGVCGCVSYPYIEDLERELEANYKPNFAHPNGQILESSLFDESALIGQWECQVDVQSHTLCGDDIMSRMADGPMIEKLSFNFNADGTYIHNSSKQTVRPVLISYAGKWRYEKGELKLLQKTLKIGDRSFSHEIELRYRVVWFSDGRALITEMDGERSFAPGESKGRIVISTDKYGVQMEKFVSVATVDNGRERGYIWVELRSPAVYSRVGGNVKGRTDTSVTASSDSADYRIVEFERQKNKDFSYAFTLELTGGAKASNLREIGKKFGAEVKQSYIDTFHSAKPAELRVLLDWRLENGSLKGVASVVHVVPVALTYDANTRVGRVTVRAEENQLPEARNWIGKNIKKIVCEKNIALETGTRPAEDAHYSVTRETVKDGGLVEVEFKAE